MYSANSRNSRMERITAMNGAARYDLRLYVSGMIRMMLSSESKLSVPPRRQVGEARAQAMVIMPMLMRRRMSSRLWLMK